MKKYFLLLTILFLQLLAFAQGKGQIDSTLLPVIRASLST